MQLCDGFTTTAISWNARMFSINNVLFMAGQEFSDASSVLLAIFHLVHQEGLTKEVSKFGYRLLVSPILQGSLANWVVFSIVF